MNEFISEAIRLEAEDNPYHEYLAFAIEDKASRLVVGSVGSSYYEDFMEVGVTYFIGADHRGNGYAAEALQRFTEYLFAKYHLNIFHGFCATIFCLTKVYPILCSI